MQTMYDDIILKISQLLSNHQKIYLTMTSTFMNKFKYKFIYREKIDVDKIIKLSYFNNFECVSISDISDEIPKYAKYVYLITYIMDLTHNPLPLATHLTFGRFFNQSIIGKIPPSVTYLEFGSCFNRSIKDSIPPSVIHLIFGFDFNQSIKNSIPSSVTHLTFGTSFDRSIKNNIPSSVTHLTFGYCFNQPIECNIPSSVTHIVFGNQFDYPLDTIPLSIKEITLRKNYNKKITPKIESLIKIKRIR